MGVSSSIVKAIEKVKTAIHKSFLWRIVDRLGLIPFFTSAYMAYCKLLTKVMDEREMVVQVGEVQAQFKVTTGSEFTHLENLDGEQPVIEDLLANLHDDDVFYDIGASIGIYAVLAAAKHPAQVAAFEPHPESLARLQENAELNDLDVKGFAYALSDTAGTVELELQGDDLGTSQHAIGSGEGGTTVQVEQQTGDKIVEEEDIRPPTVVKIDVEGAEDKTVRGMADALANSCRLLYCEVHPDKLESYGSDEETFRQRLEDLGFSLETIHRRGKQHFLKGEKD